MPRKEFENLTSNFETYRTANTLDDSISATLIFNFIRTDYYYYYYYYYYGRNSSVGIENRYGLDGPGIESRWG
jgi:hypothetical protein